MTQPGTTQPVTQPTYADAVRVGAGALLFDDPVLAKTSKTARLLAVRVIDALIASDAMHSNITKPVEAQQETLNVQ